MKSGYCKPNESSRISSKHFLHGFHSDDPQDKYHIPLIQNKDQKLSEVRINGRQKLKVHIVNSIKHSMSIATMLPLSSLEKMSVFSCQNDLM